MLDTKFTFLDFQRHEGGKVVLVKSIKVKLLVLKFVGISTLV